VITLGECAIEDLRRAEAVVRRHVAPAPLIRSEPLERALGLPSSRRAWLKDYGATPTGSFKVLGALNWVANRLAEIGDRPVVAHSSGNFASGLAFACARYGKRAIVVMPDTASEVKAALTRSFGAEIRTYDLARDPQTGERERRVLEIVEREGAVRASPYDDDHVIAGNGVGGLEIVAALRRPVSVLLAAVSGGGLMAGHALAIADAHPEAAIVAVEPETADDFRRSLEAGRRVRIDRPSSICDGLLSYDVGERNWPILRRTVRRAVAVADARTVEAMAWLREHHGLRSEPSGAIGLAALLTGGVDCSGDGDVVVVISGRNIS
jgi:threo-3-hydroxy-L-aspartate ammonia-lyase